MIDARGTVSCRDNITGTWRVFRRESPERYTLHYSPAGGFIDAIARSALFHDVMSDEGRIEATFEDAKDTEQFLIDYAMRCFNARKR